MSGNSFGTIFKITTFGESHGKGIGGIIDGCPSGLEIDLEAIAFDMNRRRPGQSDLVSPRNEKDEFEILSGVFEGKTTGTPIAFFIENKNVKSADYEHIKNIYRPSHADFTYQEKYGIRDYRGGGRSSARETAARVFAGSLAKQLLAKKGIAFSHYVSQVGKVKMPNKNIFYDLELIEKSQVRCPEEKIAQEMVACIDAVRKKGDTVGGVVSGVIQNVPAGLGEPVFQKLHAALGAAMLGINAVKGFEIGSGFESAEMLGSEHNDLFEIKEGKVATQSNFSGGIQGGISNGENITYRVAFKPVATIMQSQKTINEKGESVEAKGKGRHDACVVPRAVAIVEAMAALVIADFILLQKTNSL